MSPFANLLANLGVFLFESKYGTAATVEDAHRLLSPFGAIEICYVASQMECSVLNIANGVVVQFELYNDGQCAQSVRIFLNLPSFTVKHFAD